MNEKLSKVSASLSKFIDHRIGATHTAFGNLYKRVFENKDLSQTTELMVYHTVVISTMLYGCEAWPEGPEEAEQFHQRWLRSFLNIKWDDYIRSIPVMKQANAVSIESMIVKHRLRLSGHVARMSDARLPRQLLCRELTTGLRPRGRPLLCYKDQLKATFKTTGIDLKAWETTAANRSGWRQSISTRTSMFEADWRQKAEEKREDRKCRLAAPRSPSTLPCRR